MNDNKDLRDVVRGLDLDHLVVDHVADEFGGGHLEFALGG